MQTFIVEDSPVILQKLVATLEELARMLKAHGAVRVENFVLARALKD